MKSTTSSSVFTIIIAAIATAASSSAYTFDPLNGIWKQSGNQARMSSSASSYAPYPSSVEEEEQQAPVHFKEEVVRAQYSTWAGHYHGENKNDGETFQQKSLVQIEYNKNTGEISLLDHDGVVTKEDYQHLMRAVAGVSANNHIINGNEIVNLDDDVAAAAAAAELDVVPQDVTLGSTHFVDVDEIDLDQVIDTEGEELPAMKEDIHQQQHRHQHHHQDHESLGSFNTYTIPQPPTEISTELQQQQYQQLQHLQQQQYLQSPMAAYVPATAAFPAPPAVPTTEATADETVPQCGGWGFNHRRSSFMN